MNKRTKFLAQVAFYGLAAGLLAYAASRTLDFVNSTIPDDKQYMGYLFLLATGVGALVWLFVLLTYAEGAKQRGIAFGMGILDLAGELTLVYADTMLVASSKGTLTMTESDMQLFIMASVGIMGLNLVAAYFFKLFDPNAEAESKARDLTDEVTDATMKELNTPAAKKQMINELMPILRQSVLDKVSAEIHAAAGRYGQPKIIPGKVLPLDDDVLFAPHSPVNFQEAEPAPAEPPFPPSPTNSTATE